MLDKRIKLFVDAHCLDAEFQGTRTFVKEMYAVLTEKKDILFYFAAYETERLKKTFPPADNIIYLKYRSRSSVLRLALEIPWLIKRHKISIAHFQYITPLIKNCKQLVTIHDVIFCDYPNAFSGTYRLLKKFLYRRSAQKAEIITTVSAFSQQSIQKHLHSSPEKVHVIANGVHSRFFDDYDKQSAKKFIESKYGINRFILYVSRMEPRKNHVALLRAFLSLKLYAKGYHLVFIGHPSIKDQPLQSLLSSLPAVAGSAVFIRKQVEEDDLLQFYRAADVFVYPSKAEGFGIPPLEAGAAKIPVICSNVAAMQEFTFFDPFHIDPCNEQLFATKLSDAVSAPHPSFNLEDIALKIRARYSWTTSAAKLYQLITSN